MAAAGPYRWLAERSAEMKDAKFSLYLSADPARTPVLLEAVMPFATARVELNKSH